MGEQTCLVGQLRLGGPGEFDLHISKQLALDGKLSQDTRGCPTAGVRRLGRPVAAEFRGRHFLVVGDAGMEERSDRGGGGHAECVAPAGDGVTAGY
jgi:hypothetical protein